MVTAAPALFASSSSLYGLTMLRQEEMRQASCAPTPGISINREEGDSRISSGEENTCGDAVLRGQFLQETHDSDRAQARYQVQGYGCFPGCHE